MKVKKVKKLIQLIASIAKHPIEEVHPVQTKMTIAQGAVVLIPTTGKYALPETREIGHIIKSIEPVDLIDEAIKLNTTSQMQLMTVIRDKANPRVMVVLVNTPYGSIGYNAFIDEDQPVPYPDAGKEEPKIDKEELVEDFKQNSVEIPVVEEDMDIFKNAQIL